MHGLIYQAKALAAAEKLLFLNIEAPHFDTAFDVSVVEEFLKKEEHNPCIIVISSFHSSSTTIRVLFDSSILSRKWNGRLLNPRTRVFLQKVYNQEYLLEIKFDVDSACVQLPFKFI